MAFSTLGRMNDNNLCINIKNMRHDWRFRRRNCVMCVYGEHLDLLALAYTARNLLSHISVSSVLNNTLNTISSIPKFFFTDLYSKDRNKI